MMAGFREEKERRSVEAEKNWIEKLKMKDESLYYSELEKFEIEMEKKR